MNKEIIGYKLIKPEYENTAAKICGYPSKLDIILFGNGNFLPNSQDYLKIKEAGVLELWFTPIYKEKELKVNDYIIFQNLVDEDEHLHNGDVVKITNIRNDSIHEKWIKHIPDSFTGGGFGYKSYKNNIRKATPEEVKEYENNLLLREAEKRYPVGTKFIPAHMSNTNYSSVVTNNNFEICKRQNYNLAICAMTDDGSYYASSNNSKYGNTSYDRLVYADGKWAEILTSSFPQIIINYYKGEFFDNYVKFGCAKISVPLFIDLYNSNALKNIHDYGDKEVTSVTIGAGTFSKEQIKQIAEYYLKS